jgi:uncharacterized membrane protein (DUF373 family)
MAQRNRPGRGEIGRFAEPAVGWAERLLYLLVGAVLLIAAILIITYAIVNFFQRVGDDFLLAVLVLINDMLLVLIVLEILGTVRDFLATGSISVRISLYVGIISAIRRILAIGVQTTIGEGLDRAGFRDLMLDLGVNALVVLALAVALYLVGHQFPALLGRDGAQPESELVERGERAGESAPTS